MMLLALIIAAPVAFLLAWEIFDDLTGLLGRPRWFRGWVCLFAGHEIGDPMDEPATDRCLRCGARGKA